MSEVNTKGAVIIGISTLCIQKLTILLIRILKIMVKLKTLHLQIKLLLWYLTRPFK